MATKELTLGRQWGAGGREERGPCLCLCLGQSDVCVKHGSVFCTSPLLHRLCDSSSASVYPTSAHNTPSRGAQWKQAFCERQLFRRRLVRRALLGFLLILSTRFLPRLGKPRGTAHSQRAWPCVMPSFISKMFGKAGINVHTSVKLGNPQG